MSTRYGDGTTYLWGQYVYPMTTVIRIDVSGYVAQSSHYKLTTNAHLGPGGNAVIGVWYPGNYYLPYTVTGDPALESQKIYISMGAGSQIGMVSRSGYGNDSRNNSLGTDGSAVTCGPPWTTDYCYEYSGGSSFTITPLSSSLDVKLDSSIVNAGATAAISISASPAQVEGWNMGVIVDTVGWVPDPVSSHGIPSEARTTGACTVVSTTPIKCARTISGSGTFHVVAHVNGKRSTHDSHVAIRDRTLTLTAAPTEVHRPLDKVTFTPRWADGYPIQVKQWEWIPDVADGKTAACPGSDPVCSVGIWRSGTMRVTVTRDGVETQASAHATLTPCLTNDSIADDQGVRDAMWRSWEQSRAETESNPANRTEKEYGVYHFPDGSSRSVEITGGIETPCSVTVTPPNTIAGGGVLAYIVHPHPLVWGDTWPSNCPGMGGSTYGEGGIAKNGDNGTGRGSPDDWHASNEAGVPNVIIDFDTIEIIHGEQTRVLPIGFQLDPGQTWSGANYFVVRAKDHRNELPRNNNGCNVY